MSREEQLEQQVWELQAKLRAVEARLLQSQSLAHGYIAERAALCEELDRFGMQIGADGKIICRGPRHIVNPNTNQVHMLPILASGLEQGPLPHQPWSKDLKPIISWFRLVPDSKGQINEEFSHWEDAKRDSTKQPKKNQPLKLVLPAEGAVPDPRGGTKFTGKWVWKLQYRTDEVCPKIVTKKK